MQKLKPEEKDFIEELYKREYKVLLNYARINMRETLSREDIVQDTFLMACTKIDVLMKHERPGAWLLETLKYNIKNYRRNRENLTKFFVNILIDEWIENYPDERAQEDDLDFLYGDLVKYKEYEILKKYVVEGWSIKEIAKEYGINTNTCRQRIFRAKKLLQQICIDKEKNKKVSNFM